MRTVHLASTAAALLFPSRSLALFVQDWISSQGAIPSFIETHPARAFLQQLNVGQMALDKLAPATPILHHDLIAMLFAVFW